MTPCREEREWREWVDQKLVHALSPNIYRTPSEALQAFQYISTVGNFSMLERVAAKYCGAVIMYLVSKRLKKRYQLKEDVRESLYDFCKEWTSAVGKDRRFMGGEKPNLADLVRGQYSWSDRFGKGSHNNLGTSKRPNFALTFPEPQYRATCKISPRTSGGKYMYMYRRIGYVALYCLWLCVTGKGPIWHTCTAKPIIAKGSSTKFCTHYHHSLPIPTAII